MSHLSVI
jgi:putative lipase involved disintegration of autophagic bodies